MNLLDGTQEAIILDSLRPIFPQLNDRVLKNCIRNVGQTVGSDTASIIPRCIDMLLSGILVEPRPQENSLERQVVTISSSQDDDVVCLSPSNSLPRRVEGPFIICDSELSKSLNVTSLSCSRTGPQASVPSITETVSVSEKERNLIDENKHSTNPSLTVTTSPKPVNIQDSLPRVSLEMERSPTTIDPMNEALKDVHTLFPDADDSYVLHLIKQWSSIPLNQAVNVVCNELLENKTYPRKAAKPSATCQSLDEKPKQKDYWNDHASAVSPAYREQCFCLLHNEFRMIPLKHINDALKMFSNHYAPSKRYLEKLCLEVSVSSTGTVSSPIMSPRANSRSGNPSRLRFLKHGRPMMELPSVLDGELQREVDVVKQFERLQAVEKDRLVAMTLNDKQYEEEGQTIECACCYGDVAFDNMVQCLEGHLFCISCLMNYAKEATFGQGKAVLTCMSSDCDGTFPMSQLRKALPNNILEKYEDRVQEESLSLAQMDDFVQCPSCNFAAIMPPDDKVFKCQNPSCAKEICRYCKEDWSEHFGLKCKEVEKSSQKDVRLTYEERMTMAKIRKCGKCGCEFTKADGCNKMTCRCGTTMCYVCRKPGIGYKHFCPHPRDPGKSCVKCKSCSLWSDPSEDDNRAVKELEKEAVEAKRKLGTDIESPGNKPAKKAKTSRQERCK